MSIAARRGKADGWAAGFAAACGAAGRAPVVAVAVTMPSRGWRVRATGCPLILSRYGARGRLALSQSCNEASRRNFMWHGEKACDGLVTPDQAATSASGKNIRMVVPRPSLL